MAATTLKVIKKHCIECIGSVYETKNCKGTNIYTFNAPCPFYPYQQGKGRPSIKLIRRICRYCMS